MPKKIAFECPKCRRIFRIPYPQAIEKMHTCPYNGSQLKKILKKWGSK